MVLAVTFGGVALLLSAVGIYGMLAYQVTQRRREIGIRLALGSDRRGIFRLVLREAAIVMGVGLAFGLGGTVALGRAIESQLYGIRPLDPAVLALGCAALGVVALAASAVPARRATRIDPVTALAQE
jgi:ABC-type antimicrobial peptide transport system permease subunit